MRRPWGAIKTFSNSLRGCGLGASILVFQEVQNLSAGRRLNGGTLYGAKQVSTNSLTGSFQCNCGIVIPEFSSTAVSDFQCGRYWCGVALHNGLVILSAHFLWGKYDNTDDIITSIQMFVTSTRRKHQHISIICGFDANTTLPRNHSNTTGNNILEPLRSHSLSSQSKIIEWLQNLNMIAHNTFSSSDVTELWTCGRMRPLNKRSMIDYIASTDDLAGSARVIQQDLQGMGRCDHRPLVAELPWNAGMEMDLSDEKTTVTTLNGWSRCTPGNIPGKNSGPTRDTFGGLGTTNLRLGAANHAHARGDEG